MADADGQRGMIRHSAGDAAPLRRVVNRTQADRTIEHLVAEEGIKVPDARFRGLPLKDLDRQHLEGLCAWLMKGIHDKHLSSFMDWELPGPEV